MVDAEILAYYEHGLERDRLTAGRQQIEFPRIWDLLERFLPAPPAIWRWPAAASTPWSCSARSTT